MDHQSIASVFKSLADRHGAWFTQHVIDGVAYGGQENYLQDDRFFDFLELGRPYGDILEIGCYEGGLTARLAGLAGVRSVVAIDGRDYNVEKTSAAVAARRLSNVTVRLCDINDAVAVRSLGSFNQIYCTGVLYHLKDPWNFLVSARHLSRHIYISTHYSVAARVVHNGYRGHFFRESGYKDPLSGLQDVSFWPILGDLVRMLDDTGWTIQTLRNYPSHRALAHTTPLPLVNMQCVAKG